MTTHPILRWAAAALAMAAAVLVTNVASAAADPRLYVIQNDTLYQVNPLSPNSPIQLTNAVWTGASSMATDIRREATLYIIKDRKLWYVSTDGHITRAPGAAGVTGAFEGDTHMAWVHRTSVQPEEDDLMVTTTSHIWRVRISDGQVTNFGTPTLVIPYTSAARAFLPGATEPVFFYIAEGSLSFVTISNDGGGCVGSNGFCPDAWAGPTLMTSSEQTLYIIQTNTLFKVVPATGQTFRLTNAIWDGATSMAEVSNPTDKIYIIKDSKMWVVPGDGSSITQLSNHIWGGPTLMAAQWVTIT